MPFTFAHPAAVWPFKFLPRNSYSWTGLIIGSVVPDFEAFINMGGTKALSHSWVGMFIYDLPVGMALVLIFHFIVRHPLVDHLPALLRRRLLFLKAETHRSGFRKRWFIILLSLIVGIATHLLWDRITHTDSYTYTQRVGIALPPEENAALRQWLQWTCSIAGLLLMAWELWRLPSAQETAINQWSNFWWLAIVLATCIWLIRTNYPYEGDDLINAAIGAWLWGIILSCLYAGKLKTVPQAASADDDGNRVRAKPEQF